MDDYEPYRKDIYDDELPFDELDPCCQKEIINERKKKEINSKLRNVDRSNNRLDAKHTVFSFVSGTSCHCCQMTTDYPALRKFRNMMESIHSDKIADEEEKEKLSREDDEDDDDEFDDDFLDLDIPLTAGEQERLLAVERFKQELEIAKKYGLGVYWEDSIEHIFEFISNPSIPLILHIYSPSSTQSAIIDYNIEKYLVESYLGSRFRRIAYSYELLHSSSSSSFSSSAVDIQTAWEKYLSSNGSIICFKEGNIISYHKTLDELGEVSEDILTNLRRFFNNAHVLETTLPHPAVIFPNSASMKKVEGESEKEEEERYCDDPDCIKRFPHEHIGKSYGTPTFLISQNRLGEDALAPDLLRKL
jgi:hypothetical protein